MAERWTTRLIVSILLLCGVLMLSGCGLMQQLPGGPDIIPVKAQYTDLENRSVAVVVSTSDYTDFNHPNARPFITREVTRRIKAGVPGVTVTNPDEVLAWQEENPYWGTRPPSMMIKQLGVDRLVLVEIGQYRTHEPGDRYILRGVISATINIVEADAPDPDKFGGSYPKTVMFPRAKDTQIGMAGVSEQQIEQQTKVWFSEEAAGLFFDHELVR